MTAPTFSNRAAPSWTAETIAEHVHTLATLQMLRKAYDERGDNQLRVNELMAENLECGRALYEKIDAQGLRSVTTTTHTADLMADGSVEVRRKDE